MLCLILPWVWAGIRGNCLFGLRARKARHPTAEECQQLSRQVGELGQIQRVSLDSKASDGCVQTGFRVIQGSSYCVSVKEGRVPLLEEPLKKGTAVLL